VEKLKWRVKRDAWNVSPPAEIIAYAASQNALAVESKFDDLGVNRNPGATSASNASSSKTKSVTATRGHPEAPLRLSGSQPVATRRLPGGYP